MTSLPPPADVAVLAAYQQQTQALRTRLEAFLTHLWRSLGQYRAPQMNTFIKQAVPVIGAAQQQMSALTVGYMTAQRQAILGRSVALKVASSAVSGANARGGVDPREVYERAFHLVWRQIHDLPHEPGAIDSAIQSGLERVIESAQTDVQLSKVQTTAIAGGQDKLAKWSQRVLEGAHSCGLCIVASTQRYRPGVLMPIHPGCDCSQRTVYGDVAPPQIVDVTRLADVHDRIQQRFGASNSAARVIPGARTTEGDIIRYADVLISHEHGELGPVLGVRGQPFLGPDDI